MTIDRYTKTLLTLIGIALTAIAVNLWTGADLSRALQPRAAEAQRIMTVPKDWGKVVGFIPGHVYLEAVDGTIRLVNIGATGAPIGTIGLLIARD